MNKNTINTYDKIAEKYDVETLDFWDIFPRTFLNNFISLSKNKIVDVGSGSGRDGLIFQEAGKEVFCVDASETMIQISSNKGLKSFLAEFDKLPFEDSSIDGVWSYTALLHVPKNDIKYALNEIFRILKLGGVFALGLIEGDTEGYINSAGEDMPRWFSFYKKEEVVDLCKMHGFELVYFESFKPHSRVYLNLIFKKTI